MEDDAECSAFCFDSLSMCAWLKLVCFVHRQWRHFGDAVPLWVADMDFRCPRPVIEAMKATAEHGIYGYAGPDPGLAAATVGRLRQRYGFDTLAFDNNEEHGTSRHDCNTTRSAGAVSANDMERMIRWIPGLLPVCAKLIVLIDLPTSS